MIQDLKMQSACSGNIPSQMIANLKGGVSISTPRPVNVEFEPKSDSRAQVVPLPFPTRTTPTRKSETDEGLLKMFQRVEINILLLYAIKHIPNYAKFLKELCMHKRKKLKVGIEMGGVVSALIKSEDVIVGSQRVMPKIVETPVFFLFHAPLVTVPLQTPYWT
ncbi:hypothetical protein CR513_09851, partial [Mucuna pruriens]